MGNSPGPTANREDYLGLISRRRIGLQQLFAVFLCMTLENIGHSLKFHGSDVDACPQKIYIHHYRFQLFQSFLFIM